MAQNMNYKYNAPNDREKIDVALMRPDTRRPAKKIKDFLSDGRHLGMFFLVSAGIVFILPDLTLPMFLVCGVAMLTVWRKVSREALPMRMPSFDGGTDYGDPMPGSGRTKYFKASGVMHLGNDQYDGAQLWVNKRDALTHFMVFGGTGSGKTEVLVSFAANYLMLSSGLAYIDPKAAPKLAFQMYSLARLLWRDHDFRLMNYMTSKRRSPNGYLHPLRDSNTSNPFNRGTSENATSILTSLIAASKGDNAVFSQNAQNLMAGLMRGLVELREEHRRPLDVRVIRDSLASKIYHDVAVDDRLRPATRDSMMAFLRSMGYVETSPHEKQPPSFHQQYGYAQAYFSQPLNSLTDSYGYIFARSAMGEVDFEDVIKQRRILVVMLPSLAKSPTELSSLGKVILGGIRNAVSVGLGDHIEGTVADTLDASPMASKYPFGTFVDEYAAIATEGFVQVLTQGRGLGISALIGTQDYAGLKHASEIEAQQAVENSTIKLFGKMDTGESTFQLFKQIVGEMDVAANAGSEMDMATGAWRDQGRSSFSRVSRIDLGDMQRQIEGEFHTYFRGSLIRANVFYANPRIKKKDQLRINAMLPIPWPTEKEARDAAGQYAEAVAALREWMANPNPDGAEGKSEDFVALSSVLAAPKAGGRERGAAAVAMWGMMAWQASERAVGGGGGMKNRPSPQDGAAVVDDVPAQISRAEAIERQERMAQRRSGDAPASRSSLDMLDDEPAVDPASADAQGLRVRERPESAVPPDAGRDERQDPRSRGGRNALDELDDEPESGNAVVTEQVESLLDDAAGKAGMTEKVVQKTMDTIQYPKPPLPQVLKNEDAQKLLADVRARMLGGS